MIYPSRAQKRARSKLCGRARPAIDQQLAGRMGCLGINCGAAAQWKDGQLQVAGGQAPFKKVKKGGEQDNDRTAKPVSFGEKPAGQCGDQQQVEEDEIGNGGAADVEITTG